ncbi:type IV pilin protein [Dapis sp. BLCC M126]|uniref:type IV pilin protein n=1 Tax=Dapis sp. BLCC M126 TaxID=3400189 RepID=UPI003CF9B5E0
MNKYLIFLIDKSHRHHQSKISGFTLIELLVVIIILGILASISLGSMLNMISKARETEAMTNVNYC